jgi:hypothetical protein
MKRIIISSTLAVLTLAGTTFAAGGPYSPTNWPPTIDTNKIVHYMVTDADPGFTVPSVYWTNSLLRDGTTATDQAFELGQVCGPLVTFTGHRATTAGTYMNFRDTDFTFWSTQSRIDILMQVYGDENMLISSTAPNIRVARYQLGGSNITGTNCTGTQSKTITAASVSTNNLPNYKWNWLLISVTNEPITICGTNAGRWVGAIHPGTTPPNNAYGGRNGGTIRIAAQTPATWAGLNVHAIAWGEAGAFGNPADINLFEPADASSCDPVPAQNLVGIDFNAGWTNNLQVMNDLDQTVTFTNSIGPAGDLRKAVIPDGTYLNFGILSNYLGKACNLNVPIKVCVDFYDDPALAGATFGPESHAADQFGGTCAPNVALNTGLYTLQGTDKWIRKSWTIPGVNLYGVNTFPLTGGPRFTSLGGQVAVSRFEMAALRTTGPLAGQDPLASCRPDPLVCEDVYGIYAEWDLPNGIANGLTLGNNSADQAWTNEIAGPPGDLRNSVRNADGTAQYLNFALVNEPFGPTAQGNCRLAIAVTYFDDPALADGTNGLRAQTWTYESLGSPAQGFLNFPQDAIILQGSNTWREAYWEIGRITFDGVVQHPAATRFQGSFGTDTTKKIHISRVRYAVIRDCGTNAGVNLLATNVPALTSAKLGAVLSPDGQMTKVSWPYHAPQARLERIMSLNGTNTWGNQPFYDPGVATIEGGETRVFSITNSSSNNRFLRLVIPPAP